MYKYIFAPHVTKHEWTLVFVSFTNEFTSLLNVQVANLCDISVDRMRNMEACVRNQFDHLENKNEIRPCDNL